AGWSKSPTATMRAPSTARSPWRAGPPEPSMSVAPATMKSACKRDMVISVEFLDAGGFDDLAPLGGFAVDQLLELGGRAAGGFGAQRGQAGAHVGGLQRLLDGGVQRGDHVVGRALGRDHAAPGDGFIALHAGFVE